MLRDIRKLGIPLACVLLLVLSPASAAAQGVVVLQQDFESGAPGWTISGMAHIEPDSSACGALVAPFPSGGHAVWFGNPATCNYSGVPGAGQLAPPNPIQMPAGSGQLVIRFRRFRETEPCSDFYDVSIVHLLNSGGPFHQQVVYDCSFEPGWSDRRFDLSSWQGTAANVLISFNTGDDLLNGTLGYWVDDVEIVLEPGTVTCTADLACPCANQIAVADPFSTSANSGGCVHSFGHEARLFGNGVQSVAADTVELVVHDLPQSTSIIYVQGLTSQSVTFGDGKRCFGGTAVRLAVRGVTGGQDTYPHAGESGVALKGAVPALGGTRTYQVVYRDAATYCTSSTFDTSNGYVIAWTP